MKGSPEVQQGSLFVRPKAGASGRVYWDAQWRYRVGSEPWRQKTRRLGPAWQEPDGSGGWRKRRGRCPDGWLDERAATVAAVAAMAEHARELAEEQRARRDGGEAEATVRELVRSGSSGWRRCGGRSPRRFATTRLYCANQGSVQAGRPGTTAGRIMAAFGDRPIDAVTTAEVSRFLRGLDREKLTPRNVNKHRQVLAAMFSYACRADTYGLPVNPVVGTDKRREAPPAALDYYEVEEVEALAACASGASIGRRERSARGVRGSSEGGSAGRRSVPDPVLHRHPRR